MRRLCVPLLSLFAAILLSACATAPNKTSPPSLARVHNLGGKIAYNALAQIGRPYRYGRDTPRSGFDCSGLVHYAATRAGLREVPRTVAEQYRAAQRVRLDALKPGDILFFHFGYVRPTHDGIYIGHGQFVHAPRTGGRVRRASLHNPFWRHHLLAAGRLR